MGGIGVSKSTVMRAVDECQTSLNNEPLLEWFGRNWLKGRPDPFFLVAFLLTNSSRGLVSPPCCRLKGKLLWAGRIPVSLISDTAFGRQWGRLQGTWTLHNGEHMQWGVLGVSDRH